MYAYGESVPSSRVNRSRQERRTGGSVCRVAGGVAGFVGSKVIGWSLLVRAAGGRCMTSGGRSRPWPGLLRHPVDVGDHLGPGRVRGLLALFDAHQRVPDGGLDVTGARSLV